MENTVELRQQIIPQGQSQIKEAYLQLYRIILVQSFRKDKNYCKIVQIIITIFHTILALINIEYTPKQMIISHIIIITHQIITKKII